MISNDLKSQNGYQWLTSPLNRIYTYTNIYIDCLWWSVLLVIIQCIPILKSLCLTGGSTIYEKKMKRKKKEFVCSHRYQIFSGGVVFQFFSQHEMTVEYKKKKRRSRVMQNHRSWCHSTTTVGSRSTLQRRASHRKRRRRLFFFFNLPLSALPPWKDMFGNGRNWNWVTEESKNINELKSKTLIDYCFKHFKTMLPVHSWLADVLPLFR